MSIWSYLFGSDDDGPRPLPYDPTTAEGLAARWVQWVASSPTEINPVADANGSYCGTNQPEDIYFLAGCFGGTVDRRCTVSSEDSFFFPAFNMWTFGAEGPPEPLTRAHGYVKLDGVEKKSQIIATPKPFDVRGTEGNPVTGNDEVYSAVVWGLWTKLDPLSEGTHELSFGGGDGYQFSLDVHYILDVVSP